MPQSRRAIHTAGSSGVYSLSLYLFPLSPLLIYIGVLREEGSSAVIPSLSIRYTARTIHTHPGVWTAQPDLDIPGPPILAHHRVFVAVCPVVALRRAASQYAR